MTSLVNPSNINGNFPIAGQDNDSQGFRDNFTNIRNNFTFIKSEMEDLQAKAVLKSALIGSTLNNDFQGSKVKNLQVSNLTETVVDLGQFSSDKLQIDLAQGNVVKLVATAGNDIEINSVIKNWPSSLQYTRILIYITIPATDIRITVPQNWTTDLSSIPGLRRVGGASIISFTDPGDYIYEITSVDSGTTVYFRELTTGNAVFRDPNFYMLGYGIGKVDDNPQRDGLASPTLILGFGKYLAAEPNTSQTIVDGIPYQIDDLKGGNDSLLLKGSITAYQSQVDDSANVASGVDSLTSAGFSVVKDRTYIDAEADDAVSQERIQDTDLVGYFNAIGLTKNAAGAAENAYRQLGAVQFVANGTTAGAYGIGGKILIKTKGDGAIDDAMPNSVVGYHNYKATKGTLRTAVEIDNKQNVWLYGNLTVFGNTTTVQSQTVTVQDKNIVLGQSGTETSNQGAGISVASDAADGGANLVLSDAGWITNRQFTIANTLPANALVVNGNARVGGNLYIDGNIFVANITYQNVEVTTSTETVQGNLVAASSTPSTSTTTGALIVVGGAGIGNGLYVNGTTYLERMSTSNALITGGSVYNITHMAATGGAFTRLVGTNFSSANAWMTGGAIGVSVATGEVIPVNNVYATTGYINNFSSPNVVITGGSISGVTLPSASSIFVTDFSTGNGVITGGYIRTVSNVYTTGVVNAGSVQTANVNATSATIVTIGAGTAYIPALNAGSANVTGTVSVGGAISTTTSVTAASLNSGSANVTGTVSVGGSITATSGLTALSLNSGSANVTGSISSGGSITATSGVTAGSLNAGSANVTGTVSVGSAISTTTSVTAASLNSGSANVTGSISSGGSITATSGVTAGSLNAASANVTGSISSGGSITATSGVTAGSLNAGSANVTGAVSVGSAITTTSSVTAFAGFNSFEANITSRVWAASLSSANIYQDGASQAIQSANVWMRPNATFDASGATNAVIGNPSTGNVYIQQANLTLKAGTTAIAPIRFATGVNLTTPVFGAMEYDGFTLNFTPNTNFGRAAVPAAVYTSGAGSSLGLNTETTPVALFPAANDTITLPIGTYRLTLAVKFTRGAIVTSAALRIRLQSASGAAAGTFTGQAISSATTDGGASANFPITGSIAADTTVTAASVTSSGTYNVFMTGILRITSAGTFIPQYSLSALINSTPTIDAGNFMIIETLATSGSAAATGGWG